MNETPEKPSQPAPTSQPIKRRYFRAFLMAIFMIFLFIQGIQVNRANPPIEMDLEAPDDVEAILRRACYDCHSHETKWPWYSYVAPISWLVAYDVEEGRGYLNFSEYDGDDWFKEDCWDQIESGEMPPWIYLPPHPEAKLSDEDLAILKAWCLEDSEEEEDDEEASEEEDSEEDSPEEEAEPETSGADTDPSPETDESSTEDAE